MTEKIARRTDWKCEPFQSGVALPFTQTYSDDQFKTICRGLLPGAMEDKWFIFFEDSFLYLHRSWTGLPVYRVELTQIDDGFQVKEALSAIGNTDAGEMEYEAELLDFLIGAILLGENRSFPKSAKIQKDGGVFQHHIVGRAYPEKKSPED